MHLEVQDISGIIEPLTDFQFLSREKGVNGEKIISFSAFYTPHSLHSFPLIQGKSIINCLGEPYVITTLNKKPIGQSKYKEVVAVHKFFHDMKGKRMSQSYTRSFTFNDILTEIFRNSGYTFSIEGVFYSEAWDNFGKDNKLALFIKAIARYGAEFEISGNLVRLKKRIGRSNIDFQFRYNHNITTIDYEEDWTNFATYIEGFGKRDENGNPLITSSYTSPNATKYGIEEAPSIDDERFTTVAGLNEALIESLIDEPEVSIVLDFEDLRKQGYPYEQPQEGDEVYLIHEPLDLDLKVRIVKIVEDLDENLEPTRLKVTLANLRKSITDSTVDTGKQLRSILDVDGRIKHDVLDAETKRLTAALRSVETELVFDNGIIAVDKNDPNKLVLLNSAGLGISDDAGQTFRTALTGDGFVADAMTSGTLNTAFVRIQGTTGNIFMTGDQFKSVDANNANKFVEIVPGKITAAGGSMNIVRPDGAVFMQNGMANLNYNVQPMLPSRMEPGITTNGYYYMAQGTGDTYNVEQTCEAFSMRHDGSVLVVEVNHRLAQGATGAGGFYLRGIDDFSNQYINHGYSFTNKTEADGYKLIRIDLGKPTYQRLTFYLRLKSGSYGSNAYLYVLRIYQED